VVLPALPGVLTDFKVSGRTLLALDQRGNLLWPHDFDHLLYLDRYTDVNTRQFLYRRVDLNGDGTQDLVFGRRLLRTGRDAVR